MKLLSPVHSYKSAELQINNGADEIYLGLDSPLTVNISFSGRGRVRFDGWKIQAEPDEYEKIVNLAKKANVAVCFAGNLQFLTQDLEQLYIKYIKSAYEIGFDKLIVGDISTALIAKEILPNVPLIASSYYTVTNKGAVKFFKNLGFSRVILSEHLTINEIETIVTSDSDIEYEVFAGFGCANYNGLCYFAHNAGEREKIERLCGQCFISEDHKQTAFLMNNATDCAVCAIPKLKEIGVHSLKIVGREMNAETIAGITFMYSCAIKSNKFNVKEIVSPGWDENICKYKLCKYIDID